MKKMIGIRLAAAFALPRLTASGVGAVQLGTPGTRPETAERPSTFAGQADSGGQTTAERNAEEADNERTFFYFMYITVPRINGNIG